MQVVRSKPASYEDLREFHSEIYLQHLKTFRDIDENYTIEKLDEEYGLGKYINTSSPTLGCNMTATITFEKWYPYKWTSPRYERKLFY